MITPRKSGDISGPALLHLAVLIAFALLLVAALTSRSEVVATEHFDGTISDHQRATSDAAAQARLLAETYFGVDRLIEERSHDPILDDVSEVANSLALFKTAADSASARGMLAGRTLPDLWTELAEAKQSADEARRALGEIQGALDTVVGGREDVPTAVSELVAYNRELQIRNLQLVGQLANLERRAGAVGKPPCWVTPDGQAEYTYKITITDLELTVEPIWRAERASEMERIGASLSREIVSYDDESFSRAMYPFLAFGAESDPECRFFVQVIDETGPYKDAWQARLALVEGYFYKYWVR